MSNKRKVEFKFDDSSFSTPQELEGLEGEYITITQGDKSRQVFIPKLSHICPHCKRVHE